MKETSLIMDQYLDINDAKQTKILIFLEKFKSDEKTADEKKSDEKKMAQYLGDIKIMLKYHVLYSKYLELLIYKDNAKIKAIKTTYEDSNAELKKLIKKTNGMGIQNLIDQQNEMKSTYEETINEREDNLKNLQTEFKDVTISLFILFNFINKHPDFKPELKDLLDDAKQLLGETGFKYRFNKGFTGAVSDIVNTSKELFGDMKEDIIKQVDWLSTYMSKNTTRRRRRFIGGKPKTRRIRSKSMKRTKMRSMKRK